MQEEWDPTQVPKTRITTTAEVLAMCAELMGADEVIPGVRAFTDTETEVIAGSDLDRDGPGPWSVMTVAAQFTSPLGIVTRKAWFVDMANIDCATVAPPLGEIGMAAWNANFEDLVFLRDGIDIRWRDPMLWLALLDLGRATSDKAFYTSLNDASMRYGGQPLFGKGSIQLSFVRGMQFSDEQVDYAVQDAVYVLWLAPKIWADVVEAGLVETVDVNDGARRFIDWMRLEGIALDAEGWCAHLKKCEERRRVALARLTELTGGGEETLFGASEEPTWNPSSDAEVRATLNKWAEAEVRAYLETEVGEARLFTPADKVDGDALKLMGGELAKTLLEWKKSEKTLTTYGEGFLQKMHADGRFHARYNQALVTTGRLSSDRPNFQNLDPEMKRYLKPSARGRVFIAADYSQAELRYITVQSGDQGMWQAYESGIDIHEDTAAKMFNIEMANLLLTDPKVYKAYRSKAKPINFGIGYGMSGRTLARNMTIDGVPTKPNEGDALLERWLEIRPGVREYLNGRDAFIAHLAENPPVCDWRATWALHVTYPKMKAAYTKLKKELGYSPSAAEVADEMGNRYYVEAELERLMGHKPTVEDVDAEIASRIAMVAWMLTFKAPVVITAEGAPLQWESRTAAGSRRVWNVKTDDWVWAMVQIAALSKKPLPAQLRERWADQKGLQLSRNGKPLSRAQLRKCFDGKDGKSRQNDFIQFVLKGMPPEAAAFISRQALQDCVRARRNEYRNHPIQGGVGVIVLDAFGRLLPILKRYPTAAPVQTVHDSIVLECDAADAKALAAEVKEAMEAAFVRWCPGVKAQADVDIQFSLDGDDKVSDEMLAELIAADDTVDDTEEMPLAA
jgi:hypothetical protein